MREMFYFVAFGFLFAFLVPLLIGTLIQDDGQDPWRSQKDVVSDADPVPPLSVETAEECTEKGYSYKISEDGYAYVQKENIPYIAALIDDQVIILRLDENKSPIVIEPQDKTDSRVKSDLSAVLHSCLKSNQEPAETAISLREKKS